MSATRSIGAASTTAWKFQPWRLPQYALPRERLVARLNEALGPARATGDVVLVGAPAGYGKTTLLAQWAATEPMPVMWYHLDAGDDDPATFLYGLVRALRMRLPRGQWAVKALLANLHTGTLTPLDIRRASEVLARDIREHVTRPMTLVLTGVSELSIGGGARAVLDALLARVPDDLRLALEFREAPALKVSPLLPQHRLYGIGPDELQLTDAELVALLDRLEIPADTAYTAELQGLCSGWVTGVLLATGALWPECLAARADDDLNHEAVFDYLASEVIDHLPAALGAFAAQTAILSYLTVPLCARLFGDGPDGAERDAAVRERLAALERRTGFVTHVGRRPQEVVYRVQPLLRRALLQRLAEQFGGEHAVC
ncbi:MAG: hypothetical protein ACHQ4H_06465 [Ktedonobacterales bacterium]